MTCLTCKYSKQKLNFHHWQTWCRLYKRLMGKQCLDYKQRNPLTDNDKSNTLRIEPTESPHA